MILRFNFFALLLVVCLGCNERRVETNGQSSADTIRILNDANKKMAQQISDVNSVISTIAGTDTSDPAHAVGEYIKQSSEKIQTLTSRLAVAETVNARYSSLLTESKKEVVAKQIELSKANYQIVIFSNQNENLMHLVSLQTAEIDNKNIFGSPLQGLGEPGKNQAPRLLANCIRPFSGENLFASFLKKDYAEFIRK